MRSFVWMAMVVALAVAPAGAEERSPKIKPILIWKGLDSKQAKETFARCTNSAEWAAVWLKHCGAEKERYDVITPEVDFDSHMVVAIFGGESGHNSGIRFREVVADEQSIRVRYQDPFGQTIFVPSKDGGVKIVSDVGELDLDKKQNNFLFLVLPKSKKSMAIEQDVRRVISNPAEWKIRASFP